MDAAKASIWDERFPRQFADAIGALDKSSVRDFLRDVMTEKEIREMASRLEAARLLQLGTSYLEVNRVTSLSSRTIARVSNWLTNGTGGYTKAISAANGYPEHRRPARTS